MTTRAPLQAPSRAVPSAATPPIGIADGWIAASLFCATWIAYAPVIGAVFLLYDDVGYIANNPAVRDGLSPDSVRWAFTSGYMGNWHPLTWLSHMLDIEIFGANPRGHHATSVLLHGINSCLVFGILRGATGRRAASAFAAALFALHPLHVESVAWIAERKDVLSGFFGLLSVWSYLAYARTTGSAAAVRYVLCFAFLGMGLMAKSMLVTLPAVFLLLDVWPLERLRLPATRAVADRGTITAGRAVLEKVPLFGLSAAMSILTLLLQERAGYMTPIGLPDRLTNAVVSYVRYVGKTLWPDDLVVIYTHPNLPGGTPWTPLEVGLCSLALIVTSAGVWKWRQRPYLLVGWLWFVGMLLPVIGIVQVGLQAMADRYMYLPGIGLFIAAAFGAADLVEGRSKRTSRVAGAIAAVSIAACGALTWHQSTYWRDTEALFRRTLEVSPTNPTAHNILGVALLRRNRVDAARRHFEAALDSDPDMKEARANLSQLPR